MMKLSTKSRYGLRILAQISIDTQHQPSIKGKTISAKQEISEAYLEQIMIPLKNSGLVRTIRGCNGGYALNRDPKDVTVLEVIELFEGRVEFVKCDPCERHDFCPTCLVWGRLSKVFRDEAAKISLLEIIEQMKRSKTPEYVI